MGNDLISPADIQGRPETGSIDALARRLRAPAGHRSPKALAGAAAQVEALFIHHLFQEMRKTVPDGDGFFAESHAEKMFTDMLDGELSLRIAKAGGLGLAKLIIDQLGAHPEAGGGASTPGAPPSLGRPAVHPDHPDGPDASEEAPH